MLELVLEPLQDLASKILAFVPNLLSALVIFVIGMIVVRVLGKVLCNLSSKVNIDNFLKKTGASTELAKVGIDNPVCLTVKSIVVFLKLVVWVAVIDALGVEQLSSFTNQLILFVPNVIVAGVIAMIGAVVAGKVQSAINSVPGRENVANLSRWAILGFTGVVVLSQVGVGTEIIQTAFTAVAAAAAIAFGLGGQDKAKAIVTKYLR